ncbi:DUF5412 family protein [Terribacillus saccharophilus]|uniref:DUF5412 domain-containing protein n=2 Tax=Terribacillus saccharophilus TaxID=361277 RepID=A0A268AAM6_9BACI|nr:DUF5412 family protein [Terribacillus saccharophilus]PAD21178.1 hypothetical protein CHH64_09585 [Terribacillus saccharophilus]PAF17116.1 hypothetical protein CHH51_14645 [Terribacillus saccharophilus]PAF36205.1 hypothetical protein CHH58_13540 [Terribacillus saccharophilus]
MKKPKKWIVVIVLSIMAIVIIAGITLYNFIDVNLNELNGKGTIVSAVESPGKRYVAEIRLIDENGNATTPIGQAVSITSQGKDQIQFKNETVYWEIHSDSEVSKVNWLNEDTIEINKIEIDINDKDTYYNWQHDNEE